MVGAVRRPPELRFPVAASCFKLAGGRRCAPRRAETWASRRARGLDPASSRRPGPVPGAIQSASSSGEELRHRRRRKRLESAQLGLQLAAASVHRGVGHAVAGHHAVDAAAAEPVVGGPVFLLQVDILGSVAAGDQESSRSPWPDSSDGGTSAVGRRVRNSRFFSPVFGSYPIQTPSSRLPAIAAVQARPSTTNRSFSDMWPLGFWRVLPDFLTVVERPAGYLAVVDGQQDHVFVDQHARAGIAVAPAS